MLLSLALTLAAADYHAWAPSPPMGWNSWDCFGTTVTETQTLAQAKVMAKRLKRFGWHIVTVDIQWYEPNSKGFDYRPGARLEMDGYGRLMPASTKFPSSAKGHGFKPLGDAIHRMGLKFGIHMMRGIPRQAVEANLPIFGTSFHAADVADKHSTCPWNPDMYGVDMTKPGAQAYYDSVFRQAAGWGIDFVKVDDLSRPYHQAEIEAIRSAIDKSGRHIAFSTSPGATPLSAGSHVQDHANMWRISDDFWDNWPALVEQFKRLDDWTPYRKNGAYPDADMLPLGIVGLGRKTNFQPVEQTTLMTLWSIARSPLIFGGDLTKLDAWTRSLITNPEVIRVDQHSANNHQLFRTEDGRIAWIADAPKSKAKYLAVFNIGERDAEIPVPLPEVGLRGGVRIRDLWLRKEIGTASSFSPTLPPHGAGLYLLTPTR